MIELKKLSELMKKDNKKSIFIIDFFMITELKPGKFQINFNEILKTYQIVWKDYRLSPRITKIDKAFTSKEEAETAARYYCSKVIKFMPPLYEQECLEFLKSKPDHYSIKTILTVYGSESYVKYTVYLIWNNNYKKHLIELISEYDECLESLDLNKENYYKILDMAKEIFMSGG